MVTAFPRKDDSVDYIERKTELSYEEYSSDVPEQENVNV